MSEANPDLVSAQGDAPAGKHSKWDWFFAYGAALLVGSTCFILLIVVAEVIQTPDLWPDRLEALGLFS